MATDKGLPVPPAPAPDWTLPQIRDVRVGRAAYRPRRPRNFESPVEPVAHAIEIVVTLQSPLPIRALGPVLYIGDTALTESEAVDKEGKQIRFWALNPEVLADRAPISIGWSGSKQREMRETRFKFQKPRSGS